MIKSRGLFLQIIHRFMEQVVYRENSSFGDYRIAKTVRYIEDHYSERITVKMMAKIAGLNPTYFGLLFQKEMGVTFNRWLMQTRVKKAEDMLALGNKKLGDIAYACGFTDASHFNKQFKLAKGYSPSQSLSRKN
jgi:transcriptional regulator GlxA family with amidase domain